MGNLINFSKEEIREYGRKNGYAQMMFGDAMHDYVSSRCLILNALWPGFPLFSLSVEKFLKAMIFLETGEVSKLKNPDWHNPYKLKNELEIKSDYSLSKYNKLLKRLHGHYQSRYFDNKNRSTGMATEELYKFDELMIDLLEKIQFPKEIKFILMGLVEIFDERSLQFYPQYKYWLMFKNKYFNKIKIQELKKDYLAVAGSRN